MTRQQNRAHDELRKIIFELDCNRHADGSCLVTFGDTKVIVTASIDEKVPPYGWDC